MKTIAVIASALALIAGAHAEAPQWKTVSVQNGVKYRIDLGSIKRQTMDHADLPDGAKILVYRDDGRRPDEQELYTVVFDCRGRFMIWNHPETVDKISYGSILSKVEDAACWGPMP